MFNRIDFWCDAHHVDILQKNFRRISVNGFELKLTLKCLFANDVNDAEAEKAEVEFNC